MNEPRIKRLFRVEATDRKGTVVYRRDYQTWQAARYRADVLLQGVDEPGNPRLPEDEGFFREPAARVTIATSEVVTWPDPPQLFEVRQR